MATSDSICTCKQCKREFSASSKRFKVCSPECQALIDAAYVRPPRPTITLICKHCQKTVTRTAVRYDHGKYCSRDCSYAARSAAARAKPQPVKAAPMPKRTAAKPTPATVMLTCCICDSSFVRPHPRHRRLICSDYCGTEQRARQRAMAKANPAIRASKALHKAKRRMMETDARIEKVDPIAVFERDNWTCYLCGIPTPRELRGSTERNAPELEHRISLFNGGEHSMANTACACRECNSRKGIRNG